MNINFELYRVFYEVAKVGNITKASETLMISQPAISKSIKNLETQLGGVLFTRTQKGVKLTEEGKEFFNYISLAIEYINNAENKFTDLMNLEIGTITIGISTTLTREFLVPYLEQFNKKYPKINIIINTGATSTLIEKMKDGLIDIVVLNLPYEITNDLELIVCKEIHDCFIVNNNFNYLTKKTIKLIELNNYPLILQDRNSNTRSFLDKFMKGNNIILKPSMELSSYNLVSDFTKIGMGIGYATREYIEKEIESKKLFILKLDKEIPARNIGLIYSKKNLPSFSTKKLIELIKKDYV